MKLPLLGKLLPGTAKTSGPRILAAANEALLEKTRLLDLIVGSMGDGLLVVDQNGRCLLSNAAAKQMLGFQPYQDLPDNCTEDCGFYRAEDLERLPPTESPTNRAIRGEFIDGEEIFIRRLNYGHGIWANVTARPMCDESGVIHGAVSVFRDITVQKQAAVQQEKLRKEQAARVEAEDANKAKDHFLAMLGHELRTPLTPVLASVELLSQDAPPESEIYSTIGIIRRNIELEARLIDDILDLTAIGKGKLGLQPETIDAHAVLQTAFSIFQPEISKKGLQTRFALDATQHFILADHARLMQIFWNLIKNAVKFTPEGGAISASSRNESGKIIIEISDTGIGIEPELFPRIFEPFEQGARHVENGYGGLGLGLTISQAIAEAHGTEIVAASDGRDKGTTFSVGFDLATSPRTTSSPKSNGSPKLRETHNPERRRILLVDDHKDTATTMKRLLRKLGYEVVTAESMAEALKIGEKEGFDILVSDIGLPDGSGLELMKQLRKHHPIDGIALSGFGMEEDLRKSREAGFVDHLIKPVNLDRLQAALRRFETHANN